MKRKKGQLLAEIREALATHPEGLDSGELARRCGIERARMAVELWCMRRDGHLRATGGREQKWSVVPAVADLSALDQLVTLRAPMRPAAIPALRHVSVLVEPRTVDQVRASAEQAGLVLAPNAKITVCPGGLDTRFSVNPRQFAGGESMSNWLRMRSARAEVAE